MNDCSDSTIVIYDRNDSDLYYKTIVIYALVLARIVNYDHKVRCKLKCNLHS